MTTPTDAELIRLLVDCPDQATAYRRGHTDAIARVIAVMNHARASAESRPDGDALDAAVANLAVGIIRDLKTAVDMIDGTKPLPGTPCRKCSECDGHHHWIDTMAYGCKHCDAMIAACDDCQQPDELGHECEDDDADPG